MKNKPLISIAVITGIAVLGLALTKADIGLFLSRGFSSVGQAVTAVIDFFGYTGIGILMMFESMIIPLPSELVMPFAGFLVAQGKMSFVMVVMASTLGSLTGSLLSYWFGYYGGNALVLKLGKYLLLDVTDLEKTEKWFSKKGDKIIFVSRFIPVVRHLISIPAGIGKMDLKAFCLYTVLGASMWNGSLTYLGYVLGKNWSVIRHYSEKISILVAVLLLIGGILFISRHIKNKRTERKALEELKKIKV